MGTPIYKLQEAHMSRFSVSSFDGPPRQYPDQMRAIFGTAVQVAVQPLRWHREALEHLVRKALLQRFLERGDAEHAVGARASDGDTHVRRTFCHEHTDQRIARG